MDVLITGGAGFIGSRTALELAEMGDKVTVLDSFSPQIHGEDGEMSATARQIRGAAEIVHGDIRDRELLVRLARKADAVLHLAAETGTGQSMYDVVRYSDVNVVGTASLIEAMTEKSSRCGRLVVASSRSIYGEGAYACPTHGTVYPSERAALALEAGQFEPLCPTCNGQINVVPTAEVSPLQPASVYAVTKLAQENLCLSVARARGFSACALRYQNVYGAGQSLSNPYTGILSIFAREMLANRPIEIFEDGEESRDFVHVEDVVRFNVAAVHDGTITGAINVGTGQGVSVNALTKALATELGFQGEVSVSGRFRAGDIRHNIADPTRMVTNFGFATAIGFEGGVGEFAAWARDALATAGSSTAYRASLAELQVRGLMGSSRMDSR